MISNESDNYIDFSYFLTNHCNLFSITFKNNNRYSLSTINGIFCRDYDIDIHKIAKCNQIHSNNVVYITKPGIYDDTDGLISNLNHNIILQIQTADCIPIFLYDTNNYNVGLIHSGWKGSKKEIIISALDIFKQRGSNLTNIKVALGPFIKHCCFEVQSDVAELFKPKYVIKNKNRLYLDLESKIKDDLIFKGVLTENIYISNLCTYDNLDCNSFRRDKQNSSRMYSLIFNRN